jgi:hypothetical protein
MFQTKVVEKIKTHILCSITFSRKSCRLWDNVEKYGGATQATVDNIIRRMRFACWITKATDTHSECIIFLLFHCKNGYANAPQCSLICSLPVFFNTVCSQCAIRVAHTVALWQDSLWVGLPSGGPSPSAATSGLAASLQRSRPDRLYHYSCNSDDANAFTHHSPVIWIRPTFRLTTTWSPLSPQL